MMTDTTTSSRQTSAIAEMHALRRDRPFRGENLSNEMSTYAAYALDVIERQTGFEAELEPMLTALESHPGSRMRWIHIRGRHDDIVVFRDLSMLAFRSAADDLEDDDIHMGLLPIAFILDLGLHQQDPSGVAVKPMVDPVRSGGASLKLVCREGGKETELHGPLNITDLEGPLRRAFDRVEESLDHARAVAQDLPPIRRPGPAEMALFDAWEFEKEGMWIGEGSTYYWPPYLSRPVTSGRDTQDACDTLKKLGEIALWACPDLPEVMTLTLLSPLSTDDTPVVTCEFPARLARGSFMKFLSGEMLKMLNTDFESVFWMEEYDVPVGHVTGIKAAPSSGATGLPIATIKLSRPSPQRALDIHETTGHSFDTLRTFVDPQEAVDRERTLLSAPHPLGFEMADRVGEVFFVKGTEAADGEHKYPGPFNMCVVGGDTASLTESLLKRAFGTEELTGLCLQPATDGCAYAYSIVVSDEHDTHLRRPFGYASLSGCLDRSPDQIGGQIRGHSVDTYVFDVLFEQFCVAPGSCDTERRMLLTAVFEAITEIFCRLRDQGCKQDRHFEVDIRLGRSVDTRDGDNVSTADLAFFEQVVGHMRGNMAHSDIGEYLSIRDIVSLEDEDLSA